MCIFFHSFSPFFFFLLFYGFIWLYPRLKKHMRFGMGLGFVLHIILSSLTTSKWIFFREFESQCYFAVVSNTFIQTELQICHFERLVAFQIPLLKNKDSCTICRCAFVLEIVLAFNLVALSSKICILYVASVASSGRVAGNKDLTQISQ